MSDALILMDKHDLSMLLCVNNDKLVGMITERDIADRLGSSRSKKLSPSSIIFSSRFWASSNEVHFSLFSHSSFPVTYWLIAYFSPYIYAYTNLEDLLFKSIL